MSETSAKPPFLYPHPQDNTIEVKYEGYLKEN